MSCVVITEIQVEGDYFIFKIEDSPEVQIPREKVELMFDRKLKQRAVLYAGEFPVLCVNNLKNFQKLLLGKEIAAEQLKEAMIAA